MKKEKRDILSGHFLWMILCCAVPLISVALLSYLGILGSWGFYALILLCPLIHFIFMTNMASKDVHKRSSGDHMKEPEIKESVKQ